MDKESFILHTSQYRAIRMLSLEQKGMLLDMIYLKAMGEETPCDDALVGMAFAFIGERMEANEKAYAERVERRREAGRKGGLKRAANCLEGPDAEDGDAKQCQAMLSNAKQCLTDEAMLSNAKQGQARSSSAKHSDTDTDTVSDTDAVTDTDINIPSIPNVIDGSCDSGLSHSPKWAEGFKDLFNEKLREHKSAIRPIRGIQGKRLEMLRARVREWGEGAVRNVLTLAAMSPFLNGKNRRGWVATFDWLLLPTNFPKVLEGNYSDEPGGRRDEPDIMETIRAENDRREMEQEARRYHRKLVQEGRKKGCETEQEWLEFVEWYEANVWRGLSGIRN